MPAARIVQRADSLRSERSDASQTNKRVSFNRDVDVKHISQQQLQQQQLQRTGKGASVSNNVSAVSAALDRHADIQPVPAPVYNVYKEPTLLSEAELAQEAERIIQQVDQISCTVSPNPLLANYETRSLERRNLAAAKRNNNQPIESSGSHWSRTLPTASSTKNQLLDKAGHKKTKNVEKNNILHQQQQLELQHKLDPIVEIGPQRRHSSTPPGTTTLFHPNNNGMTIEQPQVRKQSRDAATTPPKYDSGIEMEAATSRPNVNLIVAQLTEEARQRELIRRQFQEELMMTEDPLAPRLPALNLIEPDPQFGLSHNRNLPFSYTGGTSPTRISPLRSPTARFASPPPRPDPPGKAAEPVRKDIVYAQVNPARDRSLSPERNVFRSNGADKVPARGKFDVQQQQQQQSQVLRQHLRYSQDEEEEEEPEEPVDEEDLDAIKAKARFLFGDDGDQSIQRHGRELDVRNNNNRNGVQMINNNNNNNLHQNNKNGSGLSFKYSTLLPDRGQQQQQQSTDTSRNYTTKIQIGSEEKQRNKRQDRVFQYSDEEDFNRRLYKDRSVSPQPRFQPLTSRIRSLQMQSSPERYRGQPNNIEQESRTLPLVHKKPPNQVMASTRLIQEAERGRTAIRGRPEFNSSRLVQQQLQQSGQTVDRYGDDYELDGPPKPPVRVKKLSRDRMEQSPPRMTSNGKSSSKVAFNTMPWNGQTDGSESSPERSYPLHRSTTNGQSGRKMSSPYRFQQSIRPRSITPSPERRIELRRWNEPLNGQESDTASARTKGTEPEKQEKIRRQRSKFLSVFLGSKANKSSKSSSSPTVASSTKSPPPAPLAPVIKNSTAVKDVKVQTSPVAKWSAEDEAELVRQSRSLLAKGQSHPAHPQKLSNNINSKNSALGRVNEPQRVGTFYRKSSPPVDPRYRVVSNKDGHRRRSSTDRTDTSESDEVNHQRFKSLRQKSQSFNNLNYRPDPVLVLAEEQPSYRPQQQQLQQQQQRHQGNIANGGNSSDWDQGLDNAQFRSSRRYQDNNQILPEVVIESRYKQQQANGAHQQPQRAVNQDARPYASTNLIHQIGQDQPMERSGGRPVTEEPHRQMRYFGDTDLESQPSRAGGGGGYSSRYQPKAKVSRSASTAAGMGAVRRGLLNRATKQPVGSVNSSESDGSAMQSAASAESQRSVYLHATTVADIPTVTPVTNSTRAQQLQAARRKAQSREDMSALSGATGATGSTLRRTRHISRSYSVLAPWKPRHYRDKFEITYSNQQQPTMMGQPPAVVATTTNNDAGKPPRVPVRRREDVILESEDSADVYRPVGSQPRPAKSGTSVSRSSTMPKNSKLMAGWFRKKKQR